jgi:hypothetical protein
VGKYTHRVGAEVVGAGVVVVAVRCRFTTRWSDTGRRHIGHILDRYIRCVFFFRIRHVGFFSVARNVWCPSLGPNVHKVRCIRSIREHLSVRELFQVAGIHCFCGFWNVRRQNILGDAYVWWKALLDSIDTKRSPTRKRAAGLGQRALVVARARRGRLGKRIKAPDASQQEAGYAEPTDPSGSTGSPKYERW